MDWEKKWCYQTWRSKMGLQIVKGIETKNSPSLGVNPLVSVCIITYNHEKFIEKCLSLIFAQERNFEIEVIIGEDASTDRTPEICRLFRAKYSDVVTLLSHQKNVGIQENLRQVLQACRGKYIAFCEGDDYWITPKKLQTQVDFLEKNPDTVLCSSRYQVFNTVTHQLDSDGFNSIMQASLAGIQFTHESMFDQWLTKTCTVVYRSEAFDPKIIDKFKYFRDNHLFYHILKNGKGFCLNFVTSIYHIHEGGVWSLKKNNYRSKIQLAVFEELARQNPSDFILQQQYEQRLLQQIEYIIENVPNPIFRFRFHLLIVKYSILKKAPGFYFLKIKQAIR